MPKLKTNRGAAKRFKKLGASVADVSIRETGPEAARGQAAGNTVVLDHGNGWVSEYSHLRRGSVAVREGQRVAAGTRLGLIGLSGMTEFPHLHFALRRYGQTIDPYSGRPPERGCRLPGEPLWSDAARAALAYRAGGPLLAGFAAARVTLDRALGAEAPPVPSADAPMLVFWAAAWGLHAGDREEIRLIGPDGDVLAEETNILAKGKAQWLRYVGRKRRGEAWPPGTYRGEYRVTRARDGRTVTVVETTRETVLR